MRACFARPLAGVLDSLLSVRAGSPSRAPPSRPRMTATGGRAAKPRRRVRCVRQRRARSRASLAAELFRPAAQQSGNGGGGGGGGGGKRGSVRSSTSKGEGTVDRTPLPAGEAGAEIVRAANPWTRAGPADDLERLRRNVKGCVACLYLLAISHGESKRSSTRADALFARTAVCSTRSRPRSSTG